MSTLAAWRTLTSDQKNAFVAAFLGWALDAFDYFLLVFVIKDVAHEFHAAKLTVTLATMLTLAFRPVGALIFGVAGDRYGRRIPLMVDILVYSFLELLTGFAPTMTAFLVLRALFGIGMGGEWGLGSSLALETLPADVRGTFSGLLQEGYPAGYLLASVVYGLAFPYVGWRGLFMIGALPAVVSLFIRARVKESPVWLNSRTQATTASANAGGLVPDASGPTTKPQPNPDNPLNPGKNSGLLAPARLFAYLVLLMTCFNFMSHGTQDLYPLFLQTQHHFDPATVSRIAIVYNCGAFLGGWFFGGLSQRLGRRRTIVTAALFAIPMIPLWAFSPTAVLLAVGAFAMQFMVQGAWGVVPAHLTELAPGLSRGTFIGLAYQTGNLIASVNAPLEQHLADRWGGNYALALAAVVGVMVIVLAIVTALGPEAKGADLGSESLPTGAENPRH
jgi:SHS family lactate transporter-like MFS transporter